MVAPPNPTTFNICGVCIATTAADQDTLVLTISICVGSNWGAILSVMFPAINVCGVCFQRNHGTFGQPRHVAECLATETLNGATWCWPFPFALGPIEVPFCRLWSQLSTFVAFVFSATTAPLANQDTLLYVFYRPVLVNQNHAKFSITGQLHLATWVKNWRIACHNLVTSK